MSNRNVYQVIDNLNVSSGWKRIFKKIQVSYFQNFYQGKANNIHFWSYQQEVANLSASDRFKFFTRFNFFALLFGPLYYLAKFMFKKGIILLALFALIVYYGGESSIPPLKYLAVFVNIYCAIYANTDYFIAKVVNSREAKDDPSVLSDMVDGNFMDKVMKEPTFYGVFIIFVLIFSAGLIWFLSDKFISDAKAQSVLARTSRVCSTKDECANLIRASLTNIRAHKEPLYLEYFNLGAAYYELGNRKDAMNALNESTKLKSNFLLPYLLKGIICTELQSYESAKYNYNRALEIYPNAKRVHYLLGSVYYKEGKYTQAKACFEKAVKAFPNKAQYWEALAYTKIYLKDTVGAKAAIERTIRILKKEGEKKNLMRIERLQAYSDSLK